MRTFEEKMYDICSWPKTIALIISYAICLIVYLDSTKELGNLEGVFFFIKQPDDFVIALISGFVVIALTIFSFISSIATYNYSLKYIRGEKKNLIFIDIIIAAFILTLSIGFMQRYATILVAAIIIVGIVWLLDKIKNN